jgi:hypothetical protein
MFYSDGGQAVKRAPRSDRFDGSVPIVHATQQQGFGVAARDGTRRQTAGSDRQGDCSTERADEPPAGDRSD